MDKLNKARKAALGILCTGLIIMLVGVLGSALAITFGQNASGYSVIVLIPIGVFGLAYGLYMIRSIDNCIRIISDINSGKESIEELCIAKTEAAKAGARKLVNKCIEEGILQGYELDNEGNLIFKSAQVSCGEDCLEKEAEDKELILQAACTECAADEDTQPKTEDKEAQAD